MFQSQKRITIALSMITLLNMTPNLVRADDSEGTYKIPFVVHDDSAVEDCKKVIAACDKALEENKKALNVYKLALENCQTQNNGLSQRVLEYEAEAQSAWHNPWFVLALGFAAGGLVFTLVK